MGGIGSGGYRENSGRPPGARNKKALQLIEQAERDDLETPISFLLRVMRDDRQALHDRLMAANICMPFMHAKLLPQPVAILDPDRMSDTALVESIRHLERFAEAEPEPPDDQPAVIRHEDYPPPPPALVVRSTRSEPPAGPRAQALRAKVDQRHLHFDPSAGRLVSRTQ